MSIPTQKHTKSRTKKRRSVIKIKGQNIKRCPKCKKVVKSHHACSFCGTYKGREVVKIRVPKKFRKKKSKDGKKENL